MSRSKVSDVHVSVVSEFFLFLIQFLHAWHTENIQACHFAPLLCHTAPNGSFWHLHQKMWDMNEENKHTQHA